VKLLVMIKVLMETTIAMIIVKAVLKKMETALMNVKITVWIVLYATIHVELLAGIKVMMETSIAMLNVWTV